MCFISFPGKRGSPRQRQHYATVVSFPRPSFLSCSATNDVREIASSSSRPSRPIKWKQHVYISNNNLEEFRRRNVGIIILIFRRSHWLNNALLTFKSPFSMISRPLTRDSIRAAKKMAFYLRRKRRRSTSSPARRPTLCEFSQGGGWREWNDSEPDV